MRRRDRRRRHQPSTPAPRVRHRNAAGRFQQGRDAHRTQAVARAGQAVPVSRHAGRAARRALPVSNGHRNLHLSPEVLWIARALRARTHRGERRAAPRRLLPKAGAFGAPRPRGRRVCRQPRRARRARRHSRACASPKLDCGGQRFRATRRPRRYDQEAKGAAKGRQDETFGLCSLAAAAYDKSGVGSGPSTSST